MERWNSLRSFVKKSRSAIGAATLVCCILWAQFATAQVSITPMVQQITVTRGGKTSFDLRIANRGDSTLVMNLHTGDLGVSDDGAPLSTTTKMKWSCANWLSFSPSVFSLEKDSIQTVKCTLSAPASAVGGHYASITCGYQIAQPPLAVQSSKDSKIAFNVGRGVTAIVMATVQSSLNTGTLKNDSLKLNSGRAPTKVVSLQPEALSGATAWSVDVPIRDEGNTHVLVKGTVSIWSDDMRLVERADLKAGHGIILPGTSRIFKAEGKKPLDDGTYLVKLEILSSDHKIVHSAFPYCVVGGAATSEVGSEGVRAMLDASNPKFGLAKGLLEFQVTPNAQRAGGLRLTNYTRDSLKVTARASSWTIDDSGKFVLNPPPNVPVKSCVPWLTLPSDTIILPPRGSATARVSVTVPEEVMGEYYAALVFESANDRHDLPAELLPASRTAIVIVKSAKNRSEGASLDVVSYKTVSPIMRTFALKLENVGNVHCFETGKLTLYDEKWRIPFDPVTFGSKQTFLLPGRSQTYVVECPGALERGKYSAVFEVQYSDSAKVAVKEFPFEAR